MEITFNNDEAVLIKQALRYSCVFYLELADRPGLADHIVKECNDYSVRLQELLERVTEAQRTAAGLPPLHKQPLAL
jgi:hypothetical protein